MHYHMERPIPPFNENDACIRLDLPAITEHFIWAELAVGGGYPHCYATLSLLVWLANLPPARLGEHAKPIFRAIIKAGHGALIPFDNRVTVMGE